MKAIPKSCSSEQADPLPRNGALLTELIAEHIAASDSTWNVAEI